MEGFNVLWVVGAAPSVGHERGNASGHTLDGAAAAVGRAPCRALKAGARRIGVRLLECIEGSGSLLTCAVGLASCRGLTRTISQRPDLPSAWLVIPQV
ncbi:hypothetical protein GCM10009827_109950 [Dactylosporangium maewongense]|uniref:Uncharacterized protein n=1 Tax=Dactylosporangium maewongense TaxID=634393 RepID=A0ABN2D463_9ACTN